MHNEMIFEELFFIFNCNVEINSIVARRFLTLLFYQDPTSDVLFYLMTLWIYTCRTLVLLAVCFMPQGVGLLRSNTYHMRSFFPSTLIRYHIHTDKDIQHTQG